MFTQRITSFFFLGFLVAACLTLTSCDENCDDCQSAIDHMYEKLPSFNCNTASMAQAVQRIKDNCNKEGQNANYIINCAVENCGGQSAAPPFCESPGVGIPFLLQTEYASSGSPPDAVELVLKLRRNGETVEQTSIFYVPGNVTYFADWQYNDGDLLTLQLYDDSPVPEALSPVAEYEMRVRSASGALYYRGLTIGYNSSTNEHTLDIRNF